MVIVSNRLPFTVKLEGDGIQLTPSVGGLATGLRSYLESIPFASAHIKEFIWVGWPGSTIAAEAQESTRAHLFTERRAIPVFLSEEDVENFYMGFCNSTIWPLFHYFPMYTKYDQGYWQQYRQVNQAFADALAEIIRPGDVVWIHDYHLTLLPKLLRKQSPGATIGFFLHIPFPTFEIFRLLPGAWRRDILEGLLGADLVGFHTFDYMQDFLRCILRVLGHAHNMGKITLSDRVVNAGSFPMGIDFKSFFEAAMSRDVREEREKLLDQLGRLKIILSVDRLDYSKGILTRLEGFEKLLNAHPEWRAKATLIMVVVPSRIGVIDYEQTQRQIEERVGNINGHFGTIGWTPILYQFRSLSFHELVALYSISHVGLVTPLQDGMNLVAKEYVASRPDKTGVLVLSERAGAAKELCEAIIINPNNREEICDGILEALNMPFEEQTRRNQIMQDRLKRYDVFRWATDFIGDLIDAARLQHSLTIKMLSHAGEEEVGEQYRLSRRRLLFLDYDGTLMPFVNRPELAKPTSQILRILHQLGENVRNDLVIISGRDRNTMNEWFGTLPVGIVAEHGAWIKEKDADWQSSNALVNDWKPKLRPILETFADRLPGAFVEEKDYSMVWHYRAADQEQGRLAARELLDQLVRFTANIDLQVLQGKKIVEVRVSGINKGLAAGRWLTKQPFDFILAIGDDWTDEDLFDALPPEAFSIRVGIDPTSARYNIYGAHEVLQLLEKLTIRDTVESYP